MALSKQMLEENEMNGYAGYARNDQYNPAVIRRMNGEMLKALEAPKVRAWMQQNGLVIEGRSPEDLVALHKTGFEAYRKVISAIGIKPE